jgi:hypothetical protein
MRGAFFEDFDLDVDTWREGKTDAKEGGGSHIGAPTERSKGAYISSSTCGCGKTGTRVVLHYGEDEGVRSDKYMKRC